jgi:Ca-activated chloride channel family protein
LAVSEVYPRRTPDLFVGRPVIFTGRCRNRSGTVRVHGNAAGRPVSLTVNAGVAKPVKEPALPKVWARMKISDLMERALDGGNDADLAHTIRHVALDYNLLSAHTAFVAVDAAHRTTGDPAIKTPVAVPVPEGVNAKKTVIE